MDIEHSKLVLDDFAQETNQTASKIKKKWIGYIIFRNRVMATLGIIKTIGIHPKLSEHTRYVEGINMIVQWHDQHEGNKTREHRQKILDIARWATLKLAEKRGEPPSFPPTVPHTLYKDILLQENYSTPSFLLIAYFIAILRYKITSPHDCRMVFPVVGALVENSTKNIKFPKSPRMIACVQLPGDSEKKMIKWYTELALKGPEGTMNIPEYIFYLLLEHDTAGQDENSVQSMKASKMFIDGEGQKEEPIVKLELTNGKIATTPRTRKRKGRSTKTLASAEAKTSSTNSSTPKDDDNETEEFAPPSADMWIQTNDSAQKGDQEQKTDGLEGEQGGIDKSDDPFQTFDAPGKKLERQLDNAAYQSGTQDDDTTSDDNDNDEDYTDGKTAKKPKLASPKPDRSKKKKANEPKDTLLARLNNDGHSDLRTEVISAVDFFVKAVATMNVKMRKEVEYIQQQYTNPTPCTKAMQNILEENTEIVKKTALQFGIKNLHKSMDGVDHSLNQQKENENTTEIANETDGPQVQSGTPVKNSGASKKKLTRLLRRRVGGKEDQQGRLREVIDCNFASSRSMCLQLVF